MNSEICDALGRAHELLLALKKAGLNDNLIKLIINAKGNKIAKEMTYTAFASAADKVFSLVSEFEFEINPEVNERIVRETRNSFYDSGWKFDSRLANVHGQSRVPSGKVTGMIYSCNIPVSRDIVYSLMLKKGKCPGMTGVCHAIMWQSKNGKAKDFLIKEGDRLFIFEEKPIVSTPVLARIAGGQGYYFSLEVKEKKVFIAGSLFFVIKKEEKE